MKFTVTWTEEARNEFCELFLAASDRGKLSRIVNSIEEDLAGRPTTLGEARGGQVRVVMESHYGMLFEVRPADCLVKVFHIGWLP